MSEGIGGRAKAEGAAPEAGGMPVAVAPSAKRFFLFEYLGEVRRGFAWMRTAPKPQEGILHKVRRGFIKWSKLRKARVGVVVLLVIMFSAYSLFSAQAGSMPVVPGRGPVGPGPTGNAANGTWVGTVSENGNATGNTSALPSRLAALKVTLTWADEPASFGLQNQPDELGLAIQAPNGMNWTVPETTTSPVTWSLADVTADYGAGTWAVNVNGGTMGDITRTGGLPGPCLRCVSDNGNSFTVKFEAAW